MDFLSSHWLWLVAVLAVMVVVYARSRKRRPASRRRARNLSATESARRRREISSQLQDLAGDTAPALLQAEAKRLNASESSLRTLEAALERAQRLSGVDSPSGNRRA